MYHNDLIRLSNFRKLVATVSEHPLVTKVRQRADTLRLSFKTGTWEWWFRNQILEAKPDLLIPHDPFEGRPIQIGPQYECDPLSDSILQKMHMIRHSIWEKGSFYRRRLIIQELLHKFLDEGYIHLEFPWSELKAELDGLWADDVWRRHTCKGRFLVYGKYGKVAPGRKMVEQFTNWGESGIRSVKDAWGQPTRLLRAMLCLLQYEKDITRHSLMCKLSNTIYSYRRAHARFICPNVYRALFKRFEIADMVVADPYPGFGSKAIAATLEGCHYCCPTDLSGLGGFLGTRFGTLDRDSYDVAILDYDWMAPSHRQIVQDLKMWARKADTKVVFVPRAFVGSLPPPTYSVRIETNFLLTDSPDFVYCYT